MQGSEIHVHFGRWSMVKLIVGSHLVAAGKMLMRSVGSGLESKTRGCGSGRFSNATTGPTDGYPREMRDWSKVG